MNIVIKSDNIQLLFEKYHPQHIPTPKANPIISITLNL